MRSPTGEPISGAVPPDAVKPPDPAPIPEAEPMGGIKVEYTQLELLYGIAKNIVAGQDRFSKVVSYTTIGDNLVQSESSQLLAFEANHEGGERIAGTFHYNSTIYLSDDRVDRTDHGYYSYEKVKGIQNALLQKGVRAAVDHDRGWRGGSSTIVIEKNGFFIEAQFGLPSREAEEAQIRAEVADNRKRNPDEPGYAEKYELPKIKEGLTNSSIRLTLVDKQRAEIGWEGYPKLGDQTDFQGATNAYTETYQQVIEALYIEEGLTPPDKTIILRPPVLNQDTLTQIASTEAESPIHLVESQVDPKLPSFSEIAGQDEAVAEAKRLVLAIKHPEIFEKRGVKRPKGILFYGPPGTGKTLIAKAVAAESNVPFLGVSAADIGTKWYGESERLMQEVFDLANDAVRSGTKVVLFLDELDSLAPNRENSHEATRKVVATLLQNMDGMNANPNVTIIAATNRPQDIDPALKRSGRIDKLILVGLPNAEGRQAILRVHMEKAKQAATETGELFEEGIDLSQVGQATDGMSGADLANLVNLTLEERTMAELEGREWTPISTEDMLATARKLGMIKDEKRRIGFPIPEGT